MKKILIAILLLTLPNNLVSAQDNFLKEELKNQLSTSSTWQINLLEFYKLYHQQQQITIIDIRSKTLYETSHIKGSLNIHLPTLPQTILQNPNLLPKNKPIYIICCAKDRNAYFAVLPLRMAGYQAYAINGGGIDAWKYLKLPYIEQGQAPHLNPEHNTTLTELQTKALSTINPDYHMMNAGRSYGLKLQPLEQLIQKENKDLYIIQILSEDKKNNTINKPYIKQSTTLKNLLKQPWLEKLKGQQIFFVGQDDRQLVLATIALRMLKYDAMFVVDE